MIALEPEAFFEPKTSFRSDLLKTNDTDYPLLLLKDCGILTLKTYVIINYYN
jgi:hypothetical protein